MLTFRIELSCLVFRVSYPSRRQQRAVDPEPANSARFRSAKPSFEYVFPPFSSFRTETLQIHGSSTPVAGLALILQTKVSFFFQRTQFSCTSSLLDKLTKSPPSSSRTLQKRTPFTKGTAVSSSRVKMVWNLNFFFLLRKAMSDPNQDKEISQSVKLRENRWNWKSWEEGGTGGGDWKEFSPLF